MNYQPAWDLATIPDDQFYREVGRRRSSAKPLKKVSAKRREELNRNRERVRRFRERQRAEREETAK